MVRALDAGTGYPKYMEFGESLITPIRLHDYQ